MATRCCGQWSYRQAADTLYELCGIRLSPTTLGAIAQITSAELAIKLENNSVIRKAFQTAKGRVEFYADGTSIHIRYQDGTMAWREVKVGVFAKREWGASAFPWEWNTRKLPETSAVSAFAIIGNKAEFQEYCQSERRRLGVGGVSSTVADGAPWIWSLAESVFGKTDECLDIYHAAEHIADCSKVLYRDTETATAWFERMRMKLLSEGFSGIERELLALNGLDDDKQKSVMSLLNYFRNHSGRLNYRERLASGRVIGSGQVEGACKNLVGRRLKQTGACWRLERANRMLLICSLLYADQWKGCWNSST